VQCIKSGINFTVFISFFIVESCVIYISLVTVASW